MEGTAIGAITVLCFAVPLLGKMALTNHQLRKELAQERAKYPAKFMTGKFRGKLVSSAPTSYLGWWVCTKANNSHLRNATRRDCLIELERRGISTNGLCNHG